MSISLRYKTHITEAYRFTTDDLDCQELKDLKASVKEHNRRVREFSRERGKTSKYYTLRRVRIMPRGPRVDNALDCGIHRRGFDSYLPINLGEWFDIYVHEDNPNQYQLNREIETGCTPGELKKIDALKNQVWRLELNGLMRRRKNHVL